MVHEKRCTGNDLLSHSLILLCPIIVHRDKVKLYMNTLPEFIVVKIYKEMCIISTNTLKSPNFTSYSNLTKKLKVEGY